VNPSRQTLLISLVPVERSMKTMPTVEDYMTATPQSIAVHEGLDAAQSLMQRFRVRHLAVMSGGKLVGVVSERDLAWPQALLAAHSKALTVQDVMARNPYAVRTNAPLNRVARTMAERRCGSAVVLAGTSVVGILTTVDALNALADTLEGRGTRAALESVTRKPPRGRTRPTARQPR
jgi:acetoin utilization protein AcuB